MKKVSKRWFIETHQAVLNNTRDKVLIRWNVISGLFSNYQYLLNWVTLSITVIGIVYGVYEIRKWMYSYCCYPVSYVVVTGKRCYTDNFDINQVITKLGTLGTFLTQDINLIQKQIECLPWIKQVSVRKQWPDTLKVHIVEHIPLAYWNDSQVISTTGIIFSIPVKYQNNNMRLMPILYGPEGSERFVLTNYYIFHAILKSSKFQIKSVRMDMRYSWQLLLENGINLKLGRNNVIERLYYFIKISPILFQEINKKNKCIDYIDLRYHSGFAVKWIPNLVTSACCN